jgi:hypothetical protein
MQEQLPRNEVETHHDGYRFFVVYRVNTHRKSKFGSRPRIIVSPRLLLDRQSLYQACRSFLTTVPKIERSKVKR